MTYLCNDWRGWTWLMFSWNDHSHPAISLRVRIKNYVLTLGYFRYRPKKYRQAGEMVDAPFVIDWPTVYLDKGFYVFYPRVRKPWLKVEQVDNV